MPLAPDHAALAEILPGTWRVRASNFPMWVNGGRTTPSFSYEVLTEDPLTLSDDVRYIDSKGREKHVRGVDRRSHTGFVWRGRGALGLVSSKWSVSGTSEDGRVLVVRFAKSLFTPAGVDVVSRDTEEVPELRALVAGSTEELGLSAEEFASLTWLSTEA